MTVEGVCIYYVDVSSYKNRRVILSHISVVNSELFEEFLGSATEYIFQNDICSEIFIHLYHNPDINTKKLTCNKEISQIFKNQGYKWKQLVNDANAGTRYPEPNLFLIKTQIDRFLPEARRREVRKQRRMHGANQICVGWNIFLFVVFCKIVQH